jgi:hypothetical protein
MADVKRVKKVTTLQWRAQDSDLVEGQSLRLKHWAIAITGGVANWILALLAAKIPE